MTDKVLLRVEEAAELLGLGRSKTYDLVASGSLPSLRFGRSVRIPRRRMEAWIEAQVQAVDAAREVGGAQEGALPVTGRAGWATSRASRGTAESSGPIVRDVKAVPEVETGTAEEAGHASAPRSG